MKKEILKKESLRKKPVKSKKKVEADMTFGEAISINPKVAMILAEEGMFCGGCPMALMETIEQGAEVHGKNLDEILKKLNK